MQTISGIHYNWSMPGLTSDDYFALIRNFRRHAFVLLTLFGASPAVCSSFVDGRAHPLQKLADGTLYLPHATSLRMGRLGYQSDAQSRLSVSYNCLESYAASLQDALTTPYPPYAGIGIRNPGGEYNQLNTTLLQIENEFYGTIRPKRVIHPGERPLHALRERGVEYVEVRCMDLDPFVPAGIAAPTARFIEIFLLHCLLSESPEDSPEEIAALGRNQHRTAASGREPGLKLERWDGEVELAEWGLQIIDECTPVAAALDAALGGNAHRDALASARASWLQPATLPSARVLDTLVRDCDGSFVRFGRMQSQQARNALMKLPYPPQIEYRFRQLAEESVREQERIEAADTMPFESFRRDYLSLKQLVV
jgi:glutamate--cysteine ligase